MLSIITDLLIVITENINYYVNTLYEIVYSFDRSYYRHDDNILKNIKWIEDPPDETDWNKITTMIINNLIINKLSSLLFTDLVKTFTCQIHIIYH